MRWNALAEDPSLANLDFRIETDRHGHTIMTPPPNQDHGKRQYRIARLLEDLVPQDGLSMTECPISTSDGVKAADVAWISATRDAANAGLKCLTTCPEICVEVLSPANTDNEMREKMALYFEAGATEVWFCSSGGVMAFHDASGPLGRSEFCARFPERIDLR